VSIWIKGPMISNTSPPDEKLPPTPVTTMFLTSSSIAQARKEVGEFAIAFEGQRILSLGTVERHRGDAIDHGHKKCFGE